MSGGRRGKARARRRVRARSALFLCAFSLAGMALLRLIAARLGNPAWLSTAGTLLFFALPAALGLLVVDGDQSRLLGARALSGAQALWLAAVGALAVCPMSLLADVVGAVMPAAQAGAPAPPLAAAAAQAGEEAPALLSILPALWQSGVLAPVCEELFFRGYLLGVFSRYGRAGAAATALLFAAAHGLTPGFPGQALFGLLLSALALGTGSLLAPLLSHMAYNLSLLLLAGVGLSGLFTGLSPASGLLRLMGCAAFAWALRRAFDAKGARMASDGALRLSGRELRPVLAALLAAAAAQLITEVLR